jgi:hypothetical protein
VSEFLPLATSFFPDPSTETGLYILISLLYLAGALGFILSLKWMSDAKTARKGIFAGEIGFVLAIIGTLLLPVITTTGYIYIAVAMLIGAAIGVPLGLLVPMTALPQRIALLIIQLLGALARRLAPGLGRRLAHLLLALGQFLQHPLGRPGILPAVQRSRRLRQARARRPVDQPRACSKASMNMAATSKPV